MTRWIAFLRGINVGGHRKLPMADLRQICVAKLDAQNVQTYIASGNLIFDADGTADELASKLREGIKGAFGFDVPILILNEATMRAVHDSCPFPRDAGKLVHAYLCYDDPQLDQAGVAQLKTPTEEVLVVGRTVWLFAPDGIGRSKFAARIETLLGTPATARNLNTINKMVEMLDG